MAAKKLVKEKWELLEKIATLKGAISALLKNDPVVKELEARIDACSTRINECQKGIDKTRKSLEPKKENENDHVMEFWDGLRIVTLWGAKEDCDHEVDNNNWDGIKCKKCWGWYCL